MKLLLFLLGAAFWTAPAFVIGYLGISILGVMCGTMLTILTMISFENVLLNKWDVMQFLGMAAVTALFFSFAPNMQLHPLFIGWLALAFPGMIVLAYRTWKHERDDKGFVIMLFVVVVAAVLYNCALVFHFSGNQPTGLGM